MPQVSKEEEAVHAAMGSPAAAVPAPKAEPPQQKRPSADSISFGEGSLVNLMDEETEVHVTLCTHVQQISSLSAYQPAWHLPVPREAHSAGGLLQACIDPARLSAAVSCIATRLLQCMSAMSGYCPAIPGKLWKCLHSMAS